MKSFDIGKNDQDQRLDKFLTKLMPSMPKSMLYKSIRKGRVKVNGKKTNIGYMVKIEDKLDLYINDEFFEKKRADHTEFCVKYNLDVVYEDENILVVNKPAGLVTHQCEGQTTDTLVDYIKSYLYDKKEYVPENENSFSPALCHRIDRNTSGLVIAAKNAASLRMLNQKIKDRELDKSYLCLVEGVFEKKEGVLEHYLLKNAKENKTKAFHFEKEGTFFAKTKYKTISTNGKRSLMEVTLVSGRSHQIRAQFAHMGHPLVGDQKYGGAKDRKHPYQALCAYQIIFSFQTDAGDLEYLKGKMIEIEAPAYLKNL